MLCEVSGDVVHFSFKGLPSKVAVAALADQKTNKMLLRVK